MMRVGEPETKAAVYTHPGRRRANQDAVLVRRLSSGVELVAVADGMGGHAAGEVASAMALEVLVRELETGRGLRAAFVEANRVVHEASLASAELQGMGTTLVALVRDEQGYTIANVGDSRAYLVSAAGIRQVTHDHSYVAEALQSGAMTEAEAERSPWRNALTRAIGTDADVTVDLFGPFPPRAGEAVLLCSDGLYRSVGEEVIREYVLATADVETATEALGALAFRRGSDDNISLAVVEFDGLERRPPTVTLPLPIRLHSRIVPDGPREERPAGEVQVGVPPAETPRRAAMAGPRRSGVPRSTAGLARQWGLNLGNGAFILAVLLCAAAFWWAVW